MPEIPRPTDSFIRRRFGALILALLSALSIVYLVGNERVSLWDRDEPRYAETSRQMVQSGDWVLPHFLKEVRNAKPVFIYWCQATAMELFGETAAAARLPSSIAMLATIAVLAIVLRRGVGPVRAFWTVLVLGTSLLAIVLAKMCMTDAVLLLPITVAQLCLYAMWQRRRGWNVVICFAIAIGIAGLTKGPVALAFPAMTLVMLPLLRIGLTNRQKGGQVHLFQALPNMRQKGVLTPFFKAILAMTIVAGIVGPWIYLVTQRDPGFVGSSIVKNVLQRMSRPAEHHSGPPGYYLATIWLCFFPWSLLLPAAIATAFRHRRVPALRFALAATIGPWVMFELISTKLPHYLLPVYPALALMTADVLVRAARRAIPDLAGHFRAVAVGWAGIVTLLGLLPWISIRWFTPTPANIVAIATFSAAMVALGIAAASGFERRRVWPATLGMGAGMAVAALAAWALLLPSMDCIAISRRTATMMRDAGATPADRAIMIDYKEPSLAFYQGGTIEEIADKLYLVNTPRKDWPKWIVMTEKVWRMMPTDIQRRLLVIATVRGWAYADGARIVNVMVLENAGAARSATR
jgi:4-amino-4-deoxy-L-arabinose transferase-like glycosyltransferase